MTPTKTPFDHEIHLRRLGLFTTDRLTRSVQARPCTHCAVIVLAALDDDVCALDAYADPHLLDPAGELTAVLTQRFTYRLQWRAGHYELQRRDDFSIAGAAPGAFDRHGHRADVLAEHRCGSRLSNTPARLERASTADLARFDQEPPY